MDDVSSWKPILTVEEAARWLGIGRGLAYESIRRGELPAIRVGRRLLVPLAALENMMLIASPSDIRQTGSNSAEGDRS